MGWMPCRTGCGAHRSTTATSVDGEHIPECHECEDPAYVEYFEDYLLRKRVVTISVVGGKSFVWFTKFAAGVVKSTDPKEASEKDWVPNLRLPRDRVVSTGSVEMNIPEYLLDGTTYVDAAPMTVYAMDDGSIRWGLPKE